MSELGPRPRGEVDPDGGKIDVSDLISRQRLPLPEERLAPQPPQVDRAADIDAARQQVEAAHRAVGAGEAEGADNEPDSQESNHTGIRETGEYAGEQSLLDRAYASLTAQERQPAEPNQVIAVRGLKGGIPGLLEDQAEYAVLLDYGVSVEALASGRITRGQLLEAGYVFVNKLGGGEKSIISGKIPDPDDPENTLDFSKRILLTHDEVDKVYRYQQAHPEIFGTQGQDLDEVRKDMLSFLAVATYEHPYRKEDFLLAEALPDGFSEEVRVDREVLDEGGEFEKLQQDWKTVGDYWKWQIDRYQEMNPDTTLNDLQIRHELKKVFSRQFCRDIYTWPGDVPTFGIKDVRGYRINRAIRERRKKLSGQASPFLESGFVFTENPDAEVIVKLPSGNYGKRRLNMANLHLFGAHPDFPGFTEMGGDDDQVYMTMETYVDNLYQKDPDKREDIQSEEQSVLQTIPIEQVIRQYQERLLATAMAWHEARTIGAEDESTQELVELEGADSESVTAHEEDKKRQQEELRASPDYDPWL